MSAPVITVGAISIISLSDGTSSAAVSEVMPSVSAEAWEPLREYLTPDRMMSVNLGSFLIREGDTWTLVDTGYGELPNSPGGKLLGELAKVDVQPDQISRVILTHLHGDHIGGNTMGLDGTPTPTFKNARYVVQRLDWAAFHEPGSPRNSATIGLCADPIEAAGLLDLIDGNQSLSPAISTLLTPGHTPGHQSILVSSGDEKVLILGDASHTPAQIVHPEWTPTWDGDPEQAVRTRREVFERIEQEGLKLAAGHYPYPSFGRIVRVEGKRRWQPLS